jgi:hypothetical protein
LDVFSGYISEKFYGVIPLEADMHAPRGERPDRVAKMVKLGRRRLERFEAARQHRELPTFVGALEMAMDWFLETYPGMNPDGDGPRRAVLVALGHAGAVQAGRPPEGGRRGE